jgi:hypothetical protein
MGACGHLEPSLVDGGSQRVDAFDQLRQVTDQFGDQGFSRGGGAMHDGEVNVLT